MNSQYKYFLKETTNAKADGFVGMYIEDYCISNNTLMIDFADGTRFITSAITSKSRITSRLYVHTANSVYVLAASNPKYTMYDI